MRTTRNELELEVLRLRKRYGLRLCLSYMGGVKLHRCDEYGNEGRDLSPRLTRAEMLRWLAAFEQGLEEADNKAVEAQREAAK